MSTEFAVSRFLTPHLAKQMFRGENAGWAVFMDCDILARDSIQKLFGLADKKYAVMVVKHHHDPDYQVKMEGQAQTKYERKNWSSVVLWNCEHPANAELTLETINTLPGRDLHRFCWLDDDEIGELDPCWNYLVGHTQINHEPRLVHFTDGPPTMRGYEHVDYADEFWAEMDRWAA
jgi:lipopolysaccharide biosynthesis glycosyltransferase